MKENLRVAISFIAIIVMAFLFLTSGTVSTDMNDTLVFINPNDHIDRGNTFIPCLIRREENYWSSLS